MKISCPAWALLRVQSPSFLKFLGKSGYFRNFLEHTETFRKLFKLLKNFNDLQEQIIIFWIFLELSETY
jgi:hypothetical protein